ncbi:helix-turn-helix domain-containing protein [Arcobacter arenosus]|uniref:Helix-turn-helix domain-containing protein n=1 Tax=Arcobacter arenosus TaxID=2576037 RepID=A0A5R8Y0F6_9BACT|nr:helix-turn-helix domain-containing protein [Arcobacter arenosus]TLP38349.1 helix-turn-helix domain-containing protein [Arcobacter arenosus]
MTKKIYNANFLNTKRVLLLTKDNKVIDRMNEKLTPLLKSFHINNSIYNSDFLLYDMIIIDIDYFDIQYLDSSLFNDKLKNFNIPIIYISSDLEFSILEYIDNVPLNNIILKNEQLEYIDIYIAITMKKNSKIYFNHDYSFCMRKNRFYFKYKEVNLTSLETNFIKVLLENKNRIVPYEKIIESVWEGKKCSIYSMRNVVNKIREKSYYEIIKNISNQGYIINDYKIY